MEPRPLKNDALAIFRAALRAADPAAAVRGAIRWDRRALALADGARIALAPGARIWAIGYGKASAPMAAALEELLAEHRPLAGGLVAVKDGHGVPTRGLPVVECGHPRPDARSERAARGMLEVAAAAGPEDLLIVLVSGGGSALAAAPVDGVTLDEKARVADALMAAGAPIGELNAVRKHLSRFKGGRLAAATRARVLALVLSDVIGDDPATVASGPT
ncbi:MAG: glycerate-2-kinase family protein, partial [Myxococcales bacterium]|nr:glycerate-2-kinase family protein [Myxococcales bacterium]